MGRASEASAAKILVSEGVGARFQVGGEQESRWSVMGKVCGGREVKSSQVKGFGAFGGVALGESGDRLWGRRGSLWVVWSGKSV